jgi:hypothetical protein
MRSFTLLFVLFAACSPYSPDLGKTPFLCGDNDPKCPDGYTCQAVSSKMVCVQNGGSAVDGPNMMGPCDDDSPFEMSGGNANNNSIATAFQTSVATSRSSIDMTGLAICPAGDLDYYEVTLTTTQTLNVTLIYETWGGVLQAQIQTSTGTPIGSLSPISGMMNTIGDSITNLPQGMYYIEVQGPPSGTSGELRNNYELKISTCTGTVC